MRRDRAAPSGPARRSAARTSRHSGGRATTRIPTPPSRGSAAGANSPLRAAAVGGEAGGRRAAGRDLGVPSSSHARRAFVPDHRRPARAGGMVRVRIGEVDASRRSRVTSGVARPAPAQAAAAGPHIEIPSCTCLDTRWYSAHRRSAAWCRRGRTPRMTKRSVLSILFLAAVLGGWTTARRADFAVRVQAVVLGAVPGEDFALRVRAGRFVDERRRPVHRARLGRHRAGLPLAHRRRPADLPDVHDGRGAERLRAGSVRRATGSCSRRTGSSRSTSAARDSAASAATCNA